MPLHSGFLGPEYHYAKAQKSEREFLGNPINNLILYHVHRKKKKKQEIRWKHRPESNFKGPHTDQGLYCAGEEVPEKGFK